MILCPHEFRGDRGTSVCGRVVLVRGPVDIGIKDHLGIAKSPVRNSQGKGKKSNGSEGRKKFEVHLLGGKTHGDILFLEAWGDAAVQVERQMTLGKVYCISGATVVTKAPPFSTSRLTYFCGHKRPLA